MLRLIRHEADTIGAAGNGMSPLRICVGFPFFFLFFRVSIRYTIGVGGLALALIISDLLLFFFFSNPRGRVPNSNHDHLLFSLFYFSSSSLVQKTQRSHTTRNERPYSRFLGTQAKKKKKGSRDGNMSRHHTYSTDMAE